MDDYQMDYEKYYETMKGDFEPPKKQGKGRIVLGFVCVAAVFLVAGMLIAGLVRSVQDPWEIRLPDVNPYSTPRAAASTPTPSPTPKPTPTERPMPALDGVAPYLPAQGNPIPDMVDSIAPSVVGILNYAENVPQRSTDWEGLFSEREEDEGNEAAGQEDDKEQRLQAMGTGFVISSDGYIITNAHVIQDAFEVAVELIDGRELDAEIIGSDENSDVAVLRVKDYNGLKPLKLGDSEDIRVGDYAVAVGNPLGRGLEGTVTMGIVSARARSITIDRKTNLYIQTDAAINLGNSGGPLLNMQGEVIGVNTAKTINAGYDEYGMSINAEGLGFALPINSVRRIVEQLITKGYVQRSIMGVTVLGITRNELIELGLDEGIRVKSVARGGPAARAGIRAEDVILSCDGVAFSDQQELVEYVNMTPVGTSVSVELWRGGEKLTVNVVLEEQGGVDYDDVEGAATPSPGPTE